LVQINHLYQNIEDLKKDLKAYSLNYLSDKILIQIFTSIDIDKIEKILQNLRVLFPNATIIGSTTAGEIYESEMLENSTVLSISSFEEVTINSAYSVDDDSYLLGKKISKQLYSDKNRCIIAFTDGLKHNGDIFLSAINEDYGYECPIAGGAAGDMIKFENTYTIYNDKVFENGAVAVALAGENLEVFQDYNLGWRSVGPVFTITSSDGNRVYEIDGIPVYQFYEDVLGSEVADHIPNSVISFPLIKKVNNTMIARSMIAKLEDNSIIYAGNLDEGDQVQFGIGSNKEINQYNYSYSIEEHKRNIQASFIYSCSARKQFLGKELESTFNQISNIAPAAGFFTYGEFFQKGGKNSFLNITTTMLFLNEKDTPIFSKYKENKTSAKTTSLVEKGTLNLLDYMSRRLQDDEVKIKYTQSKLDTYIKGINSALIVSRTDTNGKITFVNDMFTKISGYSEEELIGKSHNVVRHPQNSGYLFKDLWDTIKEKKNWHGSFANLAKDGSTYHVDTHIFPLLNKEDEVEEYMAIRQDITDVINAKEAYKREFAFSEMLFNNDESIIVVIKDNKMVRMNNSFFKFFPYDDLEIFLSYNDCICDLFLEEDGFLQASFEGKEWFTDALLNPYDVHKAKMIDKYSVERIYTVKVNEVYFDESEYIVATLSDITELENARIKAEHAEAMQAIFLANMSHEIRTPMNGILGFSELLLKSELEDTQRKHVDIINNSAGNLLNIINDILDFSKVESGNVVLEHIEIDFLKELDYVYELLKSLADKKSVNLVKKIDINLPQCIISDSTKLKQILTNLISNAIKFTKESGTVTIQVELLESQRLKDKVRFSIHDTGIGIPEDKLEKIFNVFSQADESTTREYGGTGLGLSISKSFVNSFGGELSVESVVGEGSVFFFELEFETCDTIFFEADDEILSEDEIIKQAKLHVLVAEDNATNRLLMESVLSDYDVNVSFAVNGEIAVDKLKDNNYDIVFMDINMPVMDGIEATKYIRERYEYVPIVALTANTLEADQNKFYEIGMDDFLAKPLNMDELKRILVHYSNLVNEAVEVNQNEIEDQDIVVNLEELVMMLQEHFKFSEATVLKLLKSFQNSFSQSIYELKLAIDNKDNKQIEDLCHKIGGSSGNLHLSIVFVSVKNMKESVRDNDYNQVLQEFNRLEKYFHNFTKAIENS